MYDSKMVNIYAKCVTIFSILAMGIGLLTMYASGMKFLFPPVESYEEFTFKAATSDELLLSLSIDTRKQYFYGIEEDSFEEERLLLYNTYEKDVKEGRFKEAMQGFVLLVMFIVVFNMHRKLVQNTGGWKRGG